jgi:hypothetical protein
MIVRATRSSGIDVYGLPGQWTILFLGTGFWAVLERWVEEWRIVIKNNKKERKTLSVSLSLYFVEYPFSES